MLNEAVALTKVLFKEFYIKIKFREMTRKYLRVQRVLTSGFVFVGSRLLVVYSD